MKKGIFFQIVIFTIILLIWNVIHLAFRFQKEQFEKQLAKVPMILISPEVRSLDSLRSYLSSQNFVGNIIIEPDSVIVRNLIEYYQIGEEEFLLHEFHLPSIMKIFLTGRDFSETAKIELESVISENYPEIVINYDNNFWLNTNRKTALLIKSYYYGNGFLALFLIVSVIYLRLFYESKYHEFWRIYRNAGGKRKKRRKQFFINSLLICLIPVFLNFAAYFGLNYYDYLPRTIDYRFFAGELVVIIFSVLLSRLFMGNHL